MRNPHAGQWRTFSFLKFRVRNERPAVLYLSVSAVPTHRNSDKVLQLELFQQTVGEILPRVRVLRHALVLPVQEDLGSGEGEGHGPHRVVRLLREFRVCDAPISQLRDEFRVGLRNEYGSSIQNLAEASASPGSIIEKERERKREREREREKIIKKRSQNGKLESAGEH